MSVRIKAVWFLLSKARLWIPSGFTVRDSDYTDKTSQECEDQNKFFMGDSKVIYNLIEFPCSAIVWVALCVVLHEFLVLLELQLPHIVNADVTGN